MEQTHEIVEMPGGQLAIASAIDETHYKIVTIQHENKQRKEMLDAIYEEDEALVQAEQVLKEAKDRRKDIMNRLSQDQRVINLDGQIKSAREELKALKKRRAIELISYVRKHNTNRISLRDGDYIIEEDAKLKKDRDDSDN